MQKKKRHHFDYSSQRLATFASMSCLLPILTSADPHPALKPHSLFLDSPSQVLLRSAPNLLPKKLRPLNLSRPTLQLKSAPPRAVRPTSHIVHVTSTLTRILTFRRTALLFLGLFGHSRTFPYLHFRLRSTTRFRALCPFCLANGHTHSPSLLAGA